MNPTGNFMLDQRMRQRQIEVHQLTLKLAIMEKNLIDPKVLVPSKEKQKIWIAAVKKEIEDLERKNRNFLP